MLSDGFKTLSGMLATTSGQVGFFDAAELAGPLPEGSFFALLAEHGDRIVRDEDFAACYAERMGRPSIPPSLLAKVLLLQYRTGVSDEQAMECIAWDLRWKVALGLAVDHRGWHPTSLTRFRARLLLHELERVALERTLAVAEELAEKPDCRWREKAERERMLTRVAEDAERALRAVEHAVGLLDDDGVAAAHRLLRELIGQDFEVDDDGVPRLHRGTRAGRIVSVVDTEMRHGRKSQHRRFDGFKLSAAVTNTPEPLVTAVEVAPASAQDSLQAKHLIDAQPPKRRPPWVLGDTADGTGPVRAELAERGVEVLPARPACKPPGPPHWSTSTRSAAA